MFVQQENIPVLALTVTPSITPDVTPRGHVQ